jgi:hypothetical protein
MQARYLLRYGTLAVTTRIELATSGLTGQRSNLAELRHHCSRERTRTSTSRINSALPYQLGYARLVAGTGFEPALFWIMSPAP